MNALGRFLFYANIPVTIALVLWIWVGRMIFGVAGWLLLFIPIGLFPFLLPALVASLVITYTTSAKPFAFSTAQSISHLVMWTGFFGVGLFMPDAGDTDDSNRSFLTQTFHQSDQMLELSWNITLIFAVVSVIGWVAVMVTAFTARSQRQNAVTGQRQFRGAR